MDGLHPYLEGLIDKAMQQLCVELLKIKKSYFTPKGKPNWKPLKESTLRRKRSQYPGNASSFNTATGQLRDSLKVTWERIVTDNGITIRITVRAEDDEAIIKYLTKTLGRDFLTWDKPEKEFIVDRFVKLITANATRS